MVIFKEKNMERSVYNTQYLSYWYTYKQVRGNEYARVFNAEF